MNQNTVTYKDQTIRFLGTDISGSGNQSACIVENPVPEYRHCTKKPNDQAFDTTSEEAHSSKDSDYLFNKNHTVNIKNNNATVSKVAGFQDGIIEVESELPCVDKTTEDDNCECCDTRQENPKKRLSFREIIRNVISSIGSLFVSKDKDSDGDDVEYGPVRYAPHSLSTLTETTNFTKEELKTLYRTFKNECPTGVLYEETFKTIYSQFFPLGDGNLYAHYLFKAFDINKEGYISFEDFVTSLSGLLRGTFEEKLEWIFKIYDTNQDGFITPDDLQEIVKSIYAIQGPPKSGAQVRSSDDHARRVFSKLDANDDGFVTYTEFVDACRKDPSIVASLKIFDQDA